MRKIAFWLSLAVIFTFPAEDMILIPGFGSLSRLVGVAGAGFWMLTVLVSGKFRRVHVLHMAVSLFLLWNAASLLWSIDYDLSIIRIRTYAQMVGLFWLLWDLYTTREAFRAGLQAYVLGVYVTIGSLFYNFLNGIEAYEFAHGRYSASGVNPNGMGLILSLGLPVAWYLAITAGSGKKAYLLKLTNFAFIAFAAFSIVLTASRGSVIASLPAALFMLATFSRLKTLHKAAIFIAVIVVAAWAVPNLPKNTIQRIASTQEELENADLNGRTAIWSQALGAFQERPLAGHGSATHRRSIELAINAHNTFLSVLVELGLVGLAIFVTMLAITLHQAIKQPRKIDAWLCLTLLAIWFFGANVHNWEHTKHTWLIMAWVTIGANVSRVQKLPEIPKIALRTI